MILLSNIWIYPVKSLGGIALEQSEVEPRGLRYDRRWMLVDGAGRFVTQREFPEMALLRCQIDAGYLTVTHIKKPDAAIKIPLNAPEKPGNGAVVEIWSDKCPALYWSATADEWFSTVLGAPLRLVGMPDSACRQVDRQYADEGQYVSFADGYPFLIIGQSSLDALNLRLEQPIPMNRFRPNFVVTGSDPHAEDEWQDFLIGDTPMRGVKKCGRCIMPNIDQDNAHVSKDPLRTLSEYRNFGGKVCFGQNLLYTGAGAARVRVGDVVRVF